MIEPPQTANGQAESATLEFKRKWYLLDAPDLELREQQRSKLIKDVLSLANGGPTFAGDKAFLIIGADVKLQPMTQQIVVSHHKMSQFIEL